MHYKREKWTLVRYAGPASKASIGSKPIGSELASYLVLYLQHVNKKLTFGRCEARGAGNRAPHATASACAPGGTFFAWNAELRA
jgi:hypothetical protein